MSNLRFDTWTEKESLSAEIESLQAFVSRLRAQLAAQKEMTETYRAKWHSCMARKTELFVAIEKARDALGEVTK